MKHWVAPTPVTEPLLNIVLLQPEIGPNTGNIGRLCLGIGARLHLVHPLGFSTGDKAVRRAGLDYWKHVDVVEYPSADAFWDFAAGRSIHLFSARAPRPFTAASFQPGDLLIFGCESVGLPPALLGSYPAWCIPMTGPIRSLNLSNAVAIVACQALRTVDPACFADSGQSVG